MEVESAGLGVHLMSGCMSGLGESLPVQYKERRKSWCIQDWACSLWDSCWPLVGPVPLQMHNNKSVINIFWVHICQTFC